MTQGDKQTSDPNRRRFLKAAMGTAGVGLLAGCTGGDGDGEPETVIRTVEGEERTVIETRVVEQEEEFPSRAITHVIPFGPGGGYDTYSRLMAPYLAEEYGVDVRVLNSEGAGGQIATEFVYNAEPNGYNELNVNLQNFALTQVTEDVEYDLREMTPYAQYADAFRGIGVGTHTGIETWDGFVDAVNNNELRFASTGPGSGYVTVPAIVGEVGDLYPAENVLDNQVIYDGRGAAVQGLLAGDVDVQAGTFTSILPYTLAAGGDSTRMLMAVTAADEPPEDTPDADTLTTAGVDTAEQIEAMNNSVRLVIVPPRVPDDIASVIREAYDAVLHNDDFLADAEEAGRGIVYADHETVAQRTADIINGWEERPELLEAMGIA
jgi:tripartite-type tricarboxylate transporter receptor subunit TctC